jgi:ankyrin repeat protein
MAADAQGSTALHLLAKAGTPAARDAEAREKLARLLIGAGADVGAADREGSRPLHLAAVKNRVELTALLLGAGADVAARDQYGRQALHWAAMGGFAEFMKTLVDAGADVAAADSAGDVPLHYAARRGQVDATKLLLSRGALSDVRNRGELTPLLAVASAPGGHRGIDENLISVAELLLDAGADVAARGPAGQDAVQMARDAEHDRLAAFLERLMPRSEGR